MMERETTFGMLRQGDSARVLRFGAMPEHYRNRLLSLGLTPGTEFRVIRLAPLGDPLEISLRGFRLTLRRDEAASMCVELL